MDTQQTQGCHNGDADVYAAQHLDLLPATPVLCIGGVCPSATTPSPVALEEAPKGAPSTLPPPRGPRRCYAAAPVQGPAQSRPTAWTGLTSVRSSHRRGWISRRRSCLLAGLAALCGTLALAASPALAFKGFGSRQFGTATFSEVHGIAVDQSTGEVFVYDAGAEEGSIYKFKANGEPAEFSGPKTSVITKVGKRGAGENEIAVDSATGDIYVANGFELKIFAASGAPLGELTGEGAPGFKEEICGVAVDAAGNVYVGLASSGWVNKYTPTGNPVKNSDYTSSLFGLEADLEGEPCNIATDSEENVYAAKYNGGDVKYYLKTQFNTTETSAVGTLVDAAGGGSLAVDPSSNDLYVDEGADIAQYSPAGERLASFGELGASHGVAVSGAGSTKGDVYASNSSAGDVEVFAAGELPTAITEAASAITGTTATLNGSVKPEGVKAEAIAFEFGLTTTYGERIAASPETAEGEGETAVPVIAPLSGLEPNQTYHYRAVAAGKPGASPGKDETFKTALLKPTLTATVLDVTRTSAVLEGRVNPEHSPTEYHYVYGETEAYGNMSPAVSAGEAFASSGITPLALTELKPNSTYHYALVAENQAGISQSADQTFTTGLPAPPQVSIAGASSVTQTTATISGDVNPQGLQTAYTFELAGPGEQFVPVSERSTSSQEEVSAVLTALAPATMYHYRLTAANRYGTATSGEGTFMTVSFAAPAVETFQMFPNLAGLNPPETPSSKVPIKPVTNAQKLAKALKACQKQVRHVNRKKCEKGARARYGPRSKKVVRRK